MNSELSRFKLNDPVWVKDEPGFFESWVDPSDYWKGARVGVHLLLGKPGFLVTVPHSWLRERED